jgi:hypothetical protein
MWIFFVDALRIDDWDAANVEVIRLQEQGKVIFYQKYSPEHEDPRQRPFIVVIQDDFMKTNAKRFSSGNSWAFDSTFKTNHYDLPLYAAVVPNQDGKAMPVFYMLCTKDKEGGHEGIAIELAITHVFLNIGDVRPSAFIIDKCKTSLNAIQHVVNNDIHCWEHGRLGEEQIAGRIFLCWFHVMKAWSENLLTRVPISEKDKVWQSLHVLLNCPREDHFKENLRKFYADFEHILGVEEYIRSGWADDTVPWKMMWPKFGRLYAYGGVDTTNHVERHWEWIKYTLLQGKVNRSLRDLIVAIIGSAADGSRIGGPTLLDHFKQVQAISKYILLN